MHKRTMPLWLPFTDMQAFEHDPFVITKTAGAYIQDQFGRELLDCVSSLWHVTPGHNSPAHINALLQQMQSGLVTGATFGAANTVAIDYAYELLDYIGDPRYERVFLANGGSESLEAGLKILIDYRKRRALSHRLNILYYAGSYHGVTMGALGAMGIPASREPFSEYLSGKFIGHPFPNTSGLPGDFDTTLDANEIGIVIVEPIQGAGGIRPFPKGYLRNLQQACNKRGINLIADEVVTGFWRAGAKFLYPEEGLTPDVLILSKSISGGHYPLGGAIVTTEILNAFEGQRNTFMHGNTYAGNPLAAAVGRAHLQYLRETVVQANIKNGTENLRLVRETLKMHPLVSDVRGTGLMAGVELRSSVEELKRMPRSIAALGRDVGIVLRPLGNVITIFPMFCWMEKEYEKLSTSLMKLLNNIQETVST